MNKPQYPWVFIMCILAFVEGLLFAFFTYEMCQEQLESIEDNQSYIDDLKHQFGIQNELFYDNCRLALGEDYLWWLLPTHPELKTNYFERVWPKKEIRRMRKTEEYDREQDDSDPDKKMFALELGRSQREKKILWAALALGVLGWVFCFQDLVIGEMYNQNGHLHAHWGPPSYVA